MASTKCCRCTCMHIRSFDPTRRSEATKETRVFFHDIRVRGRTQVIRSRCGFGNWDLRTNSHIQGKKSIINASICQGGTSLAGREGWSSRRSDRRAERSAKRIKRRARKG
jgi:hypothetical protein